MLFPWFDMFLTILNDISGAQVFEDKWKNFVMQNNMMKYA